ncbi:hypothetical protein FACS1894186_3500 [Alphaproteobacteria bacterium]|nr:hypothetical protein FACS1894186_3500 [Alphaproteobacteria bacterium]
MTNQQTPWHKTIAGRACGLADSATDAIYRHRNMFTSATVAMSVSSLLCGAILIPHTDMTPWLGVFPAGALGLLMADVALPNPLRTAHRETLIPLAQRRKFASWQDWRQASPLAGENENRRYNYIAWATLGASQTKD